MHAELIEAFFAFFSTLQSSTVPPIVGMLPTLRRLNRNTTTLRKRLAGGEAHVSAQKEALGALRVLVLS